AVYEAQVRIIKNGPNTTYQIISDCNFTETPPQNIYGPTGGSGGVIFIVGNTGSPSSCKWTTDGLVFGDGLQVSIGGFWLASANNGKTLITAVKSGSLVAFTNMIFGAAVGGRWGLIQEGAEMVWDGGTLQFGVAGDACLPNCVTTPFTNNGGTFNFGEGA